MRRLFLFIFLQVLIIKIIIIVSAYAEDKVFTCKPVMASVPLENGKYYFEKILPRAQSHYVVGTSGSHTTMNAKFN